jgi:ABC-type polysaccharide/polyol phosphate transport system ATPase subunit
MPAGGEPQVPPVVVDGVSKTFRLPRERVHTLKERVLHPMRRTGYTRLEALGDVSFAVEPGEFFGIVGRNGSGKSTLLKCVAGIYRADSGRIYVDGRLSTFIELGVGFNPDLAARDNVVLNALMLGLSPREARERVDRVIEFAELEEFADLKLKNYSSGMHVRLAFSVMIQVDADVLLIDEVLAVGDAAFQQKCFDEFHRLRAEGRTILLVTHDMSAVSRFCDRAVLLERGQLVATGEPEAIAEQYLAMNFARYEATRTTVDSGPATAGALAVVREVWFEDEFGQVAEFHAQGRRCVFKARVELRRDVDELGFWVAIDNDNGLRAFSTATSPHERPAFRTGEVAVLTLDFQNDLVPGWRYHVTLELEWGAERLRVERRERVASIVVTGARLTLDDQTLEHRLSVEHEQTRVA